MSPYKRFLKNVIIKSRHFFFKQMISFSLDFGSELLTRHNLSHFCNFGMGKIHHQRMGFYILIILAPIVAPLF